MTAPPLSAFPENGGVYIIIRDVGLDIKTNLLQPQSSPWGGSRGGARGSADMSWMIGEADNSVHRGVCGIQKNGGEI